MMTVSNANYVLTNKIIDEDCLAC